jgi:hypothetical protein
MGVLHKAEDTRLGRPVALSHEFGWELRLAGEATFRRRQLCRSQAAAHTTQEEWRRAFERSGWHGNVTH